VLTENFEAPNPDDSFRSLVEQVLEDVIVGGFGAIELDLVKDWTLEGGAPGILVREGMTAKSLKPGDEIKATINPLHSGAEGGSYQPLAIKFKDGTPVAQPK